MKNYKSFCSERSLQKKIQIYMAKTYFESLIEETIENYCKGSGVNGETFTRDIVEYMMLWALKEAYNHWEKQSFDNNKDMCNRTRCEWDEKRRKVKLILIDALKEIDDEMSDWDILPF